MNDQNFDITLINIDLENIEDWRSGKPPSSGWWIASTQRQSSVLRWWNGIEWSYPVDRFIGMDEVLYCAELASNLQDKIEWLPRPSSWPKHSFT